jgi:hypothetical protein
LRAYLYYRPGYDYGYKDGHPDFGAVYGHAARTGYFHIGCRHSYFGSGNFNHSTAHSLPVDVHGRAPLQHVLRKYKVPGVQGYHLRLL